MIDDIIRHLGFISFYKPASQFFASFTNGDEFIILYLLLFSVKWINSIK